MPDQPKTAQQRLDQWREWAQFVFLGGGPATGTDDEMQTAVCRASHQDRIDELKNLGTWVRSGEVWKEDARDEVARAIENRVRWLEQQHASTSRKPA